MRTDKQKKDVKLLYKKGISMKDIVAQTGVSKATIWRIIKKSPIKIRPAYAPRKIGKMTEEHVIRLYNTGDTIKDIIQQTGVKSQQTIYAILRRNNIDIRTNKNKNG